ncbi:MAG: gamma-butyrobetaine hydroxylase-like domain-containing protein, partial [Rhodospirillales bacterium]|nr:gamma-butyrobetaine hydroxylase-like domain-containing protein [Rhodospirillales bacterium]
MLTQDQGAARTTAAIADDAAQAVCITWADGRVDTLHYLWLRDNCPQSCCRHANGQRLIETRSIPNDIAPLNVQLNDAGELRIAWNHD